MGWRSYLWVLCSGYSLWRTRKDGSVGRIALRSLDFTHSRKVILLGLLWSPFSYGNECLALNIYFEARGESLAGQLAVGHVTLNRVASSKFPNSLCEVVYQRKSPAKYRCQFSWYCDGVREVVRDKVAYSKALELARYLLEYRPLDITEGALWYHSKKVTPYWAESFRVTVTIDDHIFYAEG